MSSKHRNFLPYIHTPMSKESIMLIYESNKINFNKCELYGDFVESLLLLIFDTYLGDESTSLKEQKNHFIWCWKKNLENFSLENIKFNDTNIFDYFLEFMFEVYYTLESKTSKDESSILTLWSNTFNYDRIKTNSELDNFIEIYKLFEESLLKTH